MPYLQFDRDTEEFLQINEIDGEVIERVFMREIKVFRENAGNFELLSVNPQTASEVWTPVEES